MQAVSVLLLWGQQHCERQVGSGTPHAGGGIATNLAWVAAGGLRCDPCAGVAVLSYLYLLNFMIHFLFKNTFKKPILGKNINAPEMYI